MAVNRIYPLSDSISSHPVIMAKQKTDTLLFANKIILMKILKMKHINYF